MKKLSSILCAGFALAAAMLLGNPTQAQANNIKGDPQNVGQPCNKAIACGACHAGAQAAPNVNIGATITPQAIYAPANPLVQFTLYVQGYQAQRNPLIAANNTATKAAVINIGHADVNTIFALNELNAGRAPTLNFAAIATKVDGNPNLKSGFDTAAITGVLTS